MTQGEHRNSVNSLFCSVYIFIFFALNPPSLRLERLLEVTEHTLLSLEEPSALTLQVIL